jgi:hypothetical protein
MTRPIPYNQGIDFKILPEELIALQQFFQHLGIVHVLGAIQGRYIPGQPDMQQRDDKKYEIEPFLISGNKLIYTVQWESLQYWIHKQSEIGIAEICPNILNVIR